MGWGQPSRWARAIILCSAIGWLSFSSLMTTMQSCVLIPRQYLQLPKDVKPCHNTVYAGPAPRILPRLCCGVRLLISFWITSDAGLFILGVYYDYVAMNPRVAFG